MDTRRLELMTHLDVKSAIANGFDSVLVPCGATEQHGPHLPLGMDADHADDLALAVASRMGKVLIAPTIRVGCSSHHLGFAGTISMSGPTFEAICRDYSTSLAGHGFRRICFFSGHIGNFPFLEDMNGRLNSALPAGCQVLAFTDSIGWIDAWRSAVSFAGADAAKVGGHADIAETAIMLAIRPGSVRSHLLEPGHIGALSGSDLAAMWANGIESVSKNGIIGDPRGATEDMGRMCVDAIADLLAQHFSGK